MSRFPLGLTLGFLVVALVGGFIIVRQIWSAEEAVGAIEIGSVDLSEIEDGTYGGTFIAGMIRSDVRVVVENGTMVEIEILRHDTGRGEGAEAIVDDVLAAQSLDVDLITGATNSSKVILKAIENALTGD